MNIEEGSQGQQPSFDDATSIEDLKQQAILALEKECLDLEIDLESRIKENAALKLTLKKQEENHLRMQHDLEQVKMKTQKEIMNKSACKTKLKALNEASEKLQGNFNRYCKNVNQLIPSTDKLKDILRQKKEVCQKNESKCDQMKIDYEKVLSLVTQTAQDMALLKESEAREFDEIIIHLKEQINEKRAHEEFLEERFREVDNRCKEVETKIQMLIPQKNELTNMITGLKSEIAEQKESFEVETSALKASLQEEATKKTKLTEGIADMDKKIDEANLEVREQEQEVKKLDANLKQLISECDQLNQTNKYDLEEINKLTEEVEEKSETFASLMAIDEENSLLAKQREELRKTNADLEVEIVQKRKSDDSNRSKIEELDKFIKEAEKKRDQIVKERFDIEERLRSKELETVEIDRLHKENCSELDKDYDKLCSKNEQYNKTLDEKAFLFEKLEKEQEKLDSKLKSLQEQHVASKKKCDNSFAELINFTLGEETVVKQLKEEIALLEESMGRSSIDAYKAIADTKEHKEVTKIIARLEEELENLQMTQESELELVHEENAKKIQAKQKNLEELRAQKESEFRRKEQTKTNTGIELTENLKSLEELDKQKRLTEIEIKRTNSNLEKCDMLMRTLEEKLDKVALVCMNSQSVIDPSSQTSNLFSTPKLALNNPPNPPLFNSPESDSSSGVTVIHPDKFDDLRELEVNKRATKVPPKKIPTAQKNKKNKKKFDDDDWLFN